MKKNGQSSSGQLISVIKFNVDFFSSPCCSSTHLKSGYTQYWDYHKKINNTTIIKERHTNYLHIVLTHKKDDESP